jgi:F5/8 type C domain
VEYWKDGGWTALGDLPGSPGGETLGTAQFATVASDRVRLSFGTDARMPEVSEFAVFDAPPKTVGNLAENGVYSASSSLDGNQVAANAFDGDEGTNWQACGNCWQDQWLEVDFGGEVQFDSVTVSEYDNRTSAYRIEYWTADRWRTAYQGSKPFCDRIATTIDFAPVIGSKVRILYLAGTGFAPIVYEFGVYNSGISTLPVGDLAVGGLFSASSQWDDNQSASRAFDGRAETNWQACNGCWANEWLEVDFGADTTFDSVMLSEYDNRIGSYVVEFWHDDAWHLAHEGAGPIGDRDLVQVDFTGVTGSKARVRFLSGSSFAPIIYDLGFYNLDGEEGRD